MSPTLTMPPVAPPARGGEAADARAADGADGAADGAFAHVLQHAQRQPKPSHEPPAKAAKPAADAQPRAARQPGDKPAAHDGAPLAAADDAVCADVVTVEANDAGLDVATRSAPTADEILGASTVAATNNDALPVTAPVVDSGRWAATASVDSDDEVALAIDARPSRDRSAAIGHGRRAAVPVPDRAPRADAGADARDGAPTALPLRSAPDHAAIDGAAHAAARAPTFDGKVSVEPTLVAAALTTSPREGSLVSAARDATMPHASVPAAIDEPAFGPALGHQVALWVRDGVQEARLQLHPAELGPVTVQIALDGQAAHVDFTAAVAATRDSIEQSLPALAAALRESGFTLAGGGVSGQAGHGGDTRRQRAGANNGDPSRSGAAIDGEVVAAAPRRWARSLLDVYA